VIACSTAWRVQESERDPPSFLKNEADARRESGIIEIGELGDGNDDADAALLVVESTKSKRKSEKKREREEALYGDLSKVRICCSRALACALCAHWLRCAWRRNLRTGC
jgi:hypothetical protein